VVLTSRDLVERAARECPPGTRVIGEPVGRNTAPAIAAAAHLIERESPGSAFAVMPADHAIEDGDAFAADLDAGLTAAERERVLVTFGISPRGPETNFGYTRRGARVRDRLFRVAAFEEKPPRERAERFVASGEYLWNSGIFAWRADAFLAALTATRPELAAALRPLAAAAPAAFESALDRVLPGCEAISVDHAVLEHAPNAWMVEAAFDWDDLGSWSAWARRQPHDARGNVLFGRAVAVDCDGCVVVGDGGVAAALGMRDMVVVHADGATLACRLDESDQVRRVSEAVRARGSA
jgi:mannose-1-phosphate guanylyltransferase/mannose-6-phosphate isomerase